MRSKTPKLPPIEDLAHRADQLALTLERLELQLKQVSDSGVVAPAGCWIVRYQAQGRKENYWYYKLQASTPIFPRKKDKLKLSRYKHLGKAGSKACLEAVEQVARRAQIEGIQRAIETLKQGLSDLAEEAAKYKKQ